MNHRKQPEENSEKRKAKKSFFSFFRSFFLVKKEAPVIVRIAPSPTGNLHIGTARTALFNYLFAKQNNGKFVLRIEDTDKERSKKEYEENIIEGLKWLGISWDEFYRQSERGEIYKKYLKRLIDEKKAYISRETPKEESQRSEVIRFRNPNKKIKFKDIIRGEIEFDTTELGDFVIAKSVDEPIFHFAVVVDDYEMKITHVIRGEDHISNTPRQILIQEAIRAPRPLYAHMPLTLNKQRAKLSKRDGVMSINEFKEMGYLPEAFINFLAMLGWAPKDDKELFTLEELKKEFKLENLQKGGAIFNIEKLDWFNKEWIKKMDNRYLKKIILEKTKNIKEDVLDRSLPEIKGRIEKIKDLEKLFQIGGEFEYLIILSSYKKEKLNWKNNPNEITKKHLQKILSLVGTILIDDFEIEKIKTEIFNYANKEGRGDVLWPFRFALSGKDKSIDPFTLSYILGKNETINRLENAITKLG